MRGKVHESVPADGYVGITPAYAGKRSTCRAYKQAIKDHPRLCGEKTGQKVPLALEQGSPPPMRGKDLGHAAVGGDHRITPAYAGKRNCIAAGRNAVWDHPRLCGEKAFLKSADTLKWGSPPPMRGKDERGNTEVCGWGITPAYAGKRLLYRF